MRLLQSNCEELERRRQTERSPSEKTIFLNLYKTYERSSESKQMAHSLKAVENMLKANGVIVFSGEKALLEVADYLNKAVSI
jgi:hypothetical protein